MNGWIKEWKQVPFADVGNSGERAGFVWMLSSESAL